MITLYHGTSTKYLDEILKKGLLPRDITGVSNWEGCVESKAGFIYLSDAYPVYFALQAARHDDEQCLILEVQVEEDDLYPDEDFIARCLALQDPFFAKMPLREINPLVDLEDYKHCWELSLEHNGNVAIHKVLPALITRHVTIPIDVDHIGAIMTIGGDSMPVPINYTLLGADYRTAIQKLFDEGLDAAVESKLSRWKQFEELAPETPSNIKETA